MNSDRPTLDLPDEPIRSKRVKMAIALGDLDRPAPPGEQHEAPEDSLDGWCMLALIILLMLPTAIHLGVPALERAQNRASSTPPAGRTKAAEVRTLDQPRSASGPANRSVPSISER